MEFQRILQDVFSQKEIIQFNSFSRQKADNLRDETNFLNVMNPIEKEQIFSNLKTSIVISISFSELIDKWRIHSSRNNTFPSKIGPKP